MGTSSVLIVAEDKELLNLYVNILELEGIDVFSEREGGEAIKWALKHQPDCILSSVNLPDMTGFDVLEKVHESEAIPVVFIIERADLGDIDRVFESGAMDYVLKTGNKWELLARIRNVLDRNEFETQLERRVEGGGEKIQKKDQVLEEIIAHQERRVQAVYHKLYEAFDRQVISVLNRMIPDLDPDKVTRVEAIKRKIKKILNQPEKAFKASGFFDLLTPKELEIADYVSDGFSTKEIAKIIGRSVNTVKSHRANIRDKLDLKNTGKSLKTFLQAHM